MYNLYHATKNMEITIKQTHRHPGVHTLHEPFVGRQ